MALLPITHVLVFYDFAGIKYSQQTLAYEAIIVSKSEVAERPLILRTSRNYCVHIVPTSSVVKRTKRNTDLRRGEKRHSARLPRRGREKYSSAVREDVEVGSASEAEVIYGTE